MPVCRRWQRFNEPQLETQPLLTHLPLRRPHLHIIGKEIFDPVTLPGTGVQIVRLLTQIWSNTDLFYGYRQEPPLRNTCLNAMYECIACAEIAEDEAGREVVDKGLFLSRGGDLCYALGGVQMQVVLDALEAPFMEE